MIIDHIRACCSYLQQNSCHFATLLYKPRTQKVQKTSFEKKANSIFAAYLFQQKQSFWPSRLRFKLLDQIQTI